MGRLIITTLLITALFAVGKGWEDRDLPMWKECANPLYNSTTGHKLICAWTLNPTKCPEDYYCKTHPADHFIICCPNEPECPRGEALYDTSLNPVLCDTASGTTCPANYECFGGYCCLKDANCPSTEGMQNVDCAENCGVDITKPCDNGQICCSNGCGHDCMDPDPQGGSTDPCLNHDCNPGQKCVPQLVHCAEPPPCTPQPTCLNSVDACANVDCGKGLHCQASMADETPPTGSPSVTARCYADQPCTLPADVGPCDAVFPRFFFNQATDQCEQFTYGGCDGNDNNFETVEDCFSRCGGTVKSKCDLPQVKGPCNGNMNRWYFNPLREQCESFQYGGCEGNENNFESRQDCERTCSDTPCILPSECGSTGSILRASIIYHGLILYLTFIWIKSFCT